LNIGKGLLTVASPDMRRDTFRCVITGDAAVHEKGGPAIANLYYRVPEADVEQDGMTVQGFLFVHQYAKDKEISAVSMFTPGYIREYVDETSLILKLDPDFVEPEAKETFLINDIKWSYYHDQLWRGERGNRYYEIQTQGAFTKDMMIDLLAHFQPEAQGDRVK